MADFMCIGDFVCLYCEATQGYVTSWQTSDSFSEVYIYNNQDREKPDSIPNPNMVVFQIMIQNRYKLNKAYRRTLEAVARDPDNPHLQSELAKDKVCADAETGDNMEEQETDTGTRVCYGDVIQLKHVYSGKYIHVSADETSMQDKNNLKVFLHKHNAKHAHLKVVSNFRVKEDGQEVQYNDQIVFESVKSTGQFFHASLPYQIDQFHFGSELNLGVDVSGFSCVKYFRPTPEGKKLVRSGMTVQLFHKVLEAYLVAEGLFDHELAEDVHLSVRKQNLLKPHTLEQPTSAITYWQILDEASIIRGEALRWEQSVQFRHLPSGLYLCVNRDKGVCLRSNGSDPDTVFRLHNLIKNTDQTKDEIPIDSFARVEHVMTECWLHGDPKIPYIRHQSHSDGEARTASSGLVSSDVPHIKVTASPEKQFSDAFTINSVDSKYSDLFNFVAGNVPMIINLMDIVKNNKPLAAKYSRPVCQALAELKDFMTDLNNPVKVRQKLLRNLRIIDALVKVLSCQTAERDAKEGWLNIFKMIFDIFHAYLMGDSRKNNQYFLKFVEFCQTKFIAEKSLGLKVANILVELIRGNRQILNKITLDQIDSFINQFRLTRNYIYLDLLGVTCVCGDVAITSNQLYIAQRLLQQYPNGLYATTLGELIERDPNEIYISCDDRKTWIELKHFTDKRQPLYRAERIHFLIHQLQFIHSLCFGKNTTVVDFITTKLHMYPWKEVFTALRCSELPQTLRAEYCNLLIALFVDGDTNVSQTENDNLCFVYGKITISENTAAMASTPLMDSHNHVSVVATCDLAQHFMDVKRWMKQFLDENTELIANQIAQNVLIDRVLCLLHHLINNGYYGNTSDSLSAVEQALMSILDGRSDLPHFMGRDQETRNENRSVLKSFKKSKFERSQETAAMVNAKIRALEIIDLILTFQFHKHLQNLAATFKLAERGLVMHNPGSDKYEHVLSPVILENFKPLDSSSRKIVKMQRRMIEEVKSMFKQESSDGSNQSQFTKIILGLTFYKYDNIVTKALAVLDKHFSLKLDAFKAAISAQMLLTPESCELNDVLLKVVPALRKLTNSKLTETQANTVCQMMDKLISYCKYSMDSAMPHVVNQNIIISHKMLTVLFELLSINVGQGDNAPPKELVKVVNLLRALSCENNLVKLRLFDSFTTLMQIHGLENHIALLLRDAFAGNMSICLKIGSHHVEQTVKILSQYSTQVPEILELLCAMVKVTDIPIRRNQSFVMKAMMKSFAQVADYFNQSKDYRLAVLRGDHGPNHQKYLSCLVNLIATCAEGENRMIHSMCKTILTPDEIVNVLITPGVDNNVKKPFMIYLHTVYLGSVFQTSEIGTSDLAHNSEIWRYLQKLFADIVSTTKFTRDNINLLGDMLKTPVATGKQVDRSNRQEMAHANIHFILNAVLPFVSTFVTRFYTVDEENYPNEAGIVNNLANAMLYFAEMVKPHLTNGRHMNSLLTTVVILLASSNLPPQQIDRFIEDFKQVDWSHAFSTEARKMYLSHYEEELELNIRFRRFVLNTSLLYGGYNTVAEQLQIHSRWAKNKEYTDVTGPEALPLGSYFQDHVRSFIQPQKRLMEKQYAFFGSVLHQLRSSFGPVLTNEAARISRDQLNIKCLQLLRTVIYNEMVRLPEDWKEDYDAHKQTLKRIGNIQNCLIQMKIIESVMPWMGSNNEHVVQETMSLILCLLFNASRTTQSASLAYFRSTRQESFFVSIKHSLDVSVSAYKEGRVLHNWNTARVTEIEILAKRKKMKMVLRSVREATKGLQNFERFVQEAKEKFSTIYPSSSLEQLQQVIFRRLTTDVEPKRQLGPKNMFHSNEDGDKRRKRSGQVDKKDSLAITSKDKQNAKVAFDNNNGLSMGDGYELKIFQPNGSQEPSENAVSLATTDGMSVDTALETDQAQPTAADEDDDTTKNSLTTGPGNLELVLQIIAQMCDGQNRNLQNYLRDQPDNVRNVNLVTETANVLSTLYSSINADTIEIVTQIFETINEMTSGNQATRAEVINCKIIDYVNVILRTGTYEDCEPEQIVELKLAIATLVRSLIEENGPEEKQSAIAVKDTLDLDAVCKLIGACHDAHKMRKPHLSDLKQTPEECGPLNTVRVIKNFARTTTDYLKNKLNVRHLSELNESYETLGFANFLIMRRFFDMDKNLEKICFDPNVKSTTIHMTPERRKAFYHYQSFVQTVEIVKDGYLQKVNFTVKNKNVLREEVKELVKWNLNRDSPSEKLRDFFMWYKDIAVDLRYQRKVLSNLFMTIITRYWIVWCYICMFLSLIINIFMMITWQAKLSMTDLSGWTIGVTLPDILFDPSPDVPDEAFQNYFIYIAGGIHNCFSCLVLIGYFMANNPQVSSIQLILRNIKLFFTGEKKSKTMDSTSKHRLETISSRVAVQVLSIKSLYYFAFVVFSLLGTFYQGYFFAFHMLNIMSTNTLLGGVIKSVTQNAQSLIWVTILGIIVIYIFALGGFAYERDSFIPAERMYCATLTQCFLTYVRHGLLGTYNDKFYNNVDAPGDDFVNFAWNCIPMILFFIIVSTIGLNIIFGIIVDTFSELRDAKSTAEEDMRNCCFVCGIESYIFESQSTGFRNHVQKEHNMWSYMYFMLYLSETDPNDFTTLELHVYKKMLVEHLDFFPIDRAMSLAKDEEDETDTKLEELNEKLDLLVRRMKEQEAIRRREETRLNQRRWQETHQRPLTFSGSEASARLTEDIASGISSGAESLASGFKNLFSTPKTE